VDRTFHDSNANCKGRAARRDLGIAIVNDMFSPIVPRFSKIPLLLTNMYTTTTDNQRSVEIRILEGENEVASKNILLGKFSLEGIERAPRGRPQIFTTFKIDANGILEVVSRDGRTQSSNSQVVKNLDWSKMSDSELSTYQDRLKKTEL
jgi:molecular chaperone DnaK (HSP70)